eukprot:13138222-Heterocapsa_arctica.AAC.1
MAKEAMDRAAVTRTTERRVPPQGAQTGEGPGVHQGSLHEGGQAPPPPTTEWRIHVRSRRGKRFGWRSTKRPKEM